jgi:hypothetical protein
LNIGKTELYVKGKRPQDPAVFSEALWEGHGKKFLQLEQRKPR